MPGRSTHHCPQRDFTEALTRDELSGEQRRAAQQHLEECESCRAWFRHETAQKFPRFRNYTILERIGEGGFGVVYKVIHHAKERVEALKVLFGKTPIRAAYFQNEVHLIAKLQHANIATLYEAHLGTPPYYTMEFVEGEQLDDYVRSRHLPLVDRIQLVKTVAEAVGYAHEQGVVHRDIKPQNILIGTDGQPHIIDFGIAKKLLLREVSDDDPPSSPEGVMGTFGYIAPEQIAGEQVDERADIYALGALLYHCITGDPAKFANCSERLTQILYERQVTRAADLAAIIARCVHPVPEERYSSCAVLIDDLDNYLTGRRIRARKDATPAYRVMRSAAFVLRNRPLAVQVIIVLAVALVLTVLSWRAEARWIVSGADGHSTALLFFPEQTQEAIAAGRIGGDLDGLDADEFKSWRLLRGRQMQRLAEAEPRVVVWDTYFPDCQPRFDAGLIEGFAALRAAEVPVVIGALKLDINGEPEVCPDILAAVHACGTLASTNPEMRDGEWVVPICIRRGFAKPVPGLAVAGFAAAHHPDAELDLHIESNVVVLSYRRHEVPRGEARWKQNSDPIRCKMVDQIRRDTLDGMLREGDLVFQMHVKAARDRATAMPRVSVEQVLQADLRQLRSWFRGRAVVIGHLVPEDAHRTVSGEIVYGCEIHARTIQSLLSGTTVMRFERQPLTATILLWCIIGVLLTGLIPPSRTLALRWVAWICVFGFVAGVVSIPLSARWVTDFWQIQVAMALGTLLASGCPAYLVRALRERQVRLAPELSWASEDETISSTLLASTASTDGS